MDDERELIGRGLDRLRELLGEGWQVAPVNRISATPRNGANLLGTGRSVDELVAVQSPGGSDRGEVLVEAKRSLSPVYVNTVLAPRADLMRKLTGDAAMLVIAPWLSPRTRETLRKLGYGYLDLTGNVWFRLNRPGVFIERLGAQRDPNPRSHSSRQLLRGPRAGRLVRLLVDVAPPYRAGELAAVAGISLPYVSRQLATLEEDGLITRSGRTVVDVDWPALLRSRAAQYGLLDANRHAATLAPQGPEAVLRRLRHDSAVDVSGPIAVTGSWAARAVAPVSVGGQLMLYVPPGGGTDDPFEPAAAALGVLQSDVGADVLLLHPRDPVVLQRWREVDGVHHVALSQLAIDCLGGTGRMPADGEAVIDYMMEHSGWRLSNLDSLAR